MGAAFNLLSFGLAGGSTVKAAGSLWSNLKKGALNTIMKNTMRKVAGEVVYKSTAGVVKNIAKNTAVEFAKASLIGESQFFFSLTWSKYYE